MNITVDVQVASEDDDNPDPESIRSWLITTLTCLQDAANPTSFDNNDETEVCVRIVDETESRELNNQYRQKNSPTNVLSFPADLPDGIPLQHLGDIIICNRVVKREAIEQKKEIRAHWAHMVVHGTLHLMGYDHINDDDAEEMEALETKIMVQLLFPPPYQQQSQ